MLLAHPPMAPSSGVSIVVTRNSFTISNAPPWIAALGLAAIVLIIWASASR